MINLSKIAKTLAVSALLASSALTVVNAQELPGYANWDDVKSAADGGTVNFFMWGGSDVLNGWVDEYLGGALASKYNVKLNRVPIANTGDVVNQILAEKQAGETENGSVDVLWVNGDNYKILREAEILYGPWSETIPNAKHVNWEDASIANDFGVSVDGYESPWGAAQFVFEYNSSTLENPPKTLEELQSWIAKNPGGFTYPAPPDFTGMSFIKHVFIWAAEDKTIFQKPFDQAEFDKVAPKAWDYLNAIEANLWRKGTTYPASIAAQQELLTNSEVDISMFYDPNHASQQIGNGSYPETIRTFVLDSGTLANKNYLAIPANSPNSAAAMLLANHIISPEFQLIMADPDRWGWDIPTDTSTWTDAQRTQLASYDRGVATLPLETLSGAALAEPHASWVGPMRDGWIENVLEN